MSVVPEGHAQRPVYAAIHANQCHTSPVGGQVAPRVRCRISLYEDQERRLRPAHARPFAGSAVPGVRPPAGASAARPLQTEPGPLRGTNCPSKPAAPVSLIRDQHHAPCRPNSPNSVDTHQGRLRRRYAIYDP